MHADLARAATGRIHLLFHIPKCAGQTIHRHLSTFAPKGSYYRVRKRKGPGRFLFPKYAEMPDPRGLRAVGGHWLGNSVGDIFGGQEIARSILLRDPVSQFVSHYNFRMMRYISQGLRPYPPDVAYRSRQRNYVTHFILRIFAEMSWPRLLSLTAVEKYAAVNRFLSTFWFVGDYTRCNELIAALAPDLGVPVNASVRNTCTEWHRRVQWKPLKVSDLPDRVIEQIRYDNLLDQLVWEKWGDVEQTQICTYDIYERPLANLVAMESLRLAYQVKRRFYRGWNGSTSGAVAGLPAPASDVALY